MRLFRQRTAGFTLLELMITISIIAILSAIAVPSFNYINNRRITQSQVDNLHRALNMARQMAIAKNRQTIVCPSGNGNACDTGSDWSYGYMVYVDRNRDDAYSADQDQLVEYVAGVRNVATRQGTSGLADRLRSSSSEPVIFSAQGDAMLSNAKFTYCDSVQEARFEVTVSNTGRVRVSDEAEASCSS